MITPQSVAWGLFGAFLVGMFWLAWLGHKRTRSFAEYAVGRRDMGPGLAGLTLGACLASTATFVINPGFVYAYGLPALLALTLPLFAGIAAGLWLLGPGFRRHGARATTLPAWIGERYQSAGLRAWFAALTLFHVFYLVLIVVGAAYVMSATMGVRYEVAVAIVVGVVFSYTLLGGTYAHAYTNSAQGALMLVVAVVIAYYALADLAPLGETLGRLAGEDRHLVGLTHPGSPFYRHWVEVLVCPFVIGFALVAQPHLLVKTLYLRSSADLTRFALIGGATFVVFSLVLLAGLAARVDLGGGLAQDVAAARWMAEALPAAIAPVVSVAIVAAAMSTLDGLLVAISAIVGADLAAHPAVTRRFRIEGAEAESRLALRAGRVAVVVLGVVVAIVALSPPRLVGIFGTVGTYGLLVASLPAILGGVLLRTPPSALGVGLSSVVGLGVHLGLYYGGVTINTGLTAVAGLALALPVPFVVDAARGFAGLARAERGDPLPASTVAQKI